MKKRFFAIMAAVIFCFPVQVLLAQTPPSASSPQTAPSAQTASSAPTAQAAQTATVKVSGEVLTPLPASTGPFRMVVPGEKKPARNSFQVVALTVRFAKE